MPSFLSELSIWVPIAILIAGVALFIAGSKRLDKRLKQVGAIVAILGLILALLTHFLESDREAVQRRTRELVKAVEARDWTKARSYLHPQFSFRAGDASGDASGDAMGDAPGRAGADAAIKIIQGGVELYGLTQASASTSVPDESSPTTLNPTLSVAVEIYTQGTAGPGRTDWTFEWLESNNTWLLNTAEFRGGPLIPPGEIERRLQRQ